MDNQSLEHTKPEIFNPYHPFDLESGEWFYHEDVIKKIKKIFDDHPEKRFILLYGTPGTGITSTLKRISKSNKSFGENYLPIYLDSMKYIDLDIDNLLFSLYKDIAEQLDQYGYKIQTPDYIKKRSKKELMIESILLSIDSSAIKNKILILMFDEFDNLLKKTDVKAVSDYIQYLKFIEKDWGNYGIIIAGDRTLVQTTHSEIIDQSFSTSFHIDLEETIDEDTIRRLIIEPVKNQLNYDEASIVRILWYSGKNLYFQQLICCYIVDRLNEKNKNRCSSEDVDIVIHQIMKDPRPEFDFTWETRLSLKTRIIVSALADENSIEKKGNVFLLKENSLLDNLFGKGLKNEIVKLKNLGYVNEMHQRRFLDNPFKIPLYGMWIQKKHPFTKTIIENIEAIADKIDLEVLISTIEKSPENQLSFFNKEATLEIAKKLYDLTCILLVKQTTIETALINDFLENLSRLLSLEIKKEGPLPTLNCHVMDIKDLKIGILDEAFCFIQDRPGLTKDDINKIERKALTLAENTQTKLTLFFHFQQSELVEELVKRTYLNFIALNENDLKKIMLSSRPTETFRRTILSRLSLQHISPYRTEGPAKTTFYGRSEVIKEIIGSTNTSFSIVGARKIGKSSLLYKIKENPPPNTTYIFMNLEAEFVDTKNYNDFLITLGLTIKRIFNKKVDFSGLCFGKTLRKLPNVIRQLSQEGKKIIIIIDEIDSLIEFDQKHKYKLLRIFRTLSQENSCQFIFAGFKELYHTKRDIENPLYNFCKEIILGPLDSDDALNLISKPMESIGVHFQDQEDKGLILRYTANHPNLLQFVCRHLIEKIDKHPMIEARRTIFKKDIEELLDTFYEQYVLNDMYMFFSHPNNIDKLILILLSESVSQVVNHFSISEIRGLLIDHRVSISLNDAHQNVRDLVVRFILRQDKPDNYYFALPDFPDMLRKNIDDDYKNKIIKEIQSNERRQKSI